MPSFKILANFLAFLFWPKNFASVVYKLWFTFQTCQDTRNEHCLYWNVFSVFSTGL